MKKYLFSILHFEISFRGLIYFFILIASLLISKITYADNVIVNIELKFSNIATVLIDPSPLYKTDNEYKHEYKRASEEINKYYRKLTSNVNLQREIDISWEIVNYEFLDENYVPDNGGYHLFDITWHRFAMQFQRREGDVWGPQAFSPTTSFNVAKSLPATIKGFGQVPTNSSGYIIPTKLTLWDIEQIVRHEDYRIIISRLPFTQPFYIFLTSNELKGRKWEIIGEAKGASSCVYTIIEPFYYPFDKYGFDINFKSYYPAEVNIKVTSSEDLDFHNYTSSKLSLNRLDDKEIHVTFFRDNKFRNIFWHIITALFPLILLAFEKPSKKKIVRLLIYLCAFISIQYIMPTPLNVPKYNLLYLISRLLFLGLVIIIEVNFAKRKSPTMVSKGAQ